MWAGENRRNALRMESLYAKDPYSILTSVVEGSFRKTRRKIKKREREREREKDTQQGRQRQKRRWTSIEGSISSIDPYTENNPNEQVQGAPPGVLFDPPLNKKVTLDLPLNKKVALDLVDCRRPGGGVRIISP